MSYLTMKGGVGKTTLAANVTRAMADLVPKKADGSPTKFLLVDADAQCNLSQIFLPMEQLEAHRGGSILQAFGETHKPCGPSDIKTTVYRSSTNSALIDLIVGSFDTFGFVVATPAVRGAASNAFKLFMEKARAEYDFIIIDTNPSATFTTLEALDGSDFLVSPITFDSFSMRGIDLIIKTLKERNPWLDNPRRVRIIPNKVRRASDPGERTRQEADESSVKDEFPRLRDCVSLSRIHESRFLDNRLNKRGHQFVIDQRVLPIHRPALKRVEDDFKQVGRALYAALKEAFDIEVQDQVHPRNSISGALQGFFDRTMARH